MVSIAPAARPLSKEAALTKAVATGTALPASSVNATDGNASIDNRNWFVAAAPGLQVNDARPAAVVSAAAGVTLPPVDAFAATGTPGYRRPLLSVTRTTIGSRKVPAEVDRGPRHR